MWLWCKGELRLRSRQESWSCENARLPEVADFPTSEEDRFCFSDFHPLSVHLEVSDISVLPPQQQCNQEHERKGISPLCKVRVEPYFWESWYTHRDLEIVRLRETGREKNMTVRGGRGTQLELEGSGGWRSGGAGKLSLYVSLVMEIGHSWRQQAGLEN